MKVRRIIATTILAAAVVATLFAPMFAPHAPHEQYAGFPYAPPMWPHVIDQEGRWRWPFVYPLQLTNALDRSYREDRSRRVPLLSSEHEPVFLLGTDALGRDVLSRLVSGARPSLGIAIAATAGALLIGIVVGAIAGYGKGIVDEIAMRMTEVLLVLPTLYVVFVVRAALPLVMDPAQVFMGVSAVLALIGWPIVARGVRAIVAVESTRDYVEAARASGASPARILCHHVLPATVSFLAVQVALLIPAFTIAEATLSFAGFGFAEPTPSWGTMLQDAGNIRSLGEYPWLLAPALAIAVVCAAMHSLISSESATGIVIHRR